MPLVRSLECKTVVVPSEQEQDRIRLDLLLRGFEVSQLLRLVADLEVADAIDSEGAMSIDDLADRCGVLREPLLRVLRALAASGVFRMTAAGVVTHTSLSRLLRTGVPNSLHHSARFWTAPGSWHAWGMIDAALTGEVPHEVAWQQGRFEYLRDHPDEARVFDQMMASFPDNRHHAFAAAYDFSAAALIVDVGGGNGETLRHILGRFPTPRGLLFDRDDVVAAIASDALSHERIATRAGSFFDAVPGDGDVYLLIRVLHDWPDTDCVRILRTCRAAMEPDAVLLVGEQILEPDPAKGDLIGYLMDMQMMAMFGGAKERTAAEFETLFTESGFAMRRIIETASPASLIEATPVSR